MDLWLVIDGVLHHTTQKKLTTTIFLLTHCMKISTHQKHPCKSHLLTDLATIIILLHTLSEEIPTHCVLEALLVIYFFPTCNSGTCQARGWLYRPRASFPSSFVYCSKTEYTLAATARICIG